MVSPSRNLRLAIIRNGGDTVTDLLGYLLYAAFWIGIGIVLFVVEELVVGFFNRRSHERERRSWP